MSAAAETGKNPGARQGRPRGKPGQGQGGFTILETVVSITLTAMVVLMVSTALNMSLGIWSKERHRPPEDVIYFMELLKEQVASYQLVTAKIDDKDKLLLFGEGNELAFVTDHSVRGLHGGAPVLVRYVFDPVEHRLLYGETPCIPSDPEYLEDFLKMDPGAAVRANTGLEGEEDNFEGPEFFAARVNALSFAYDLKDVADLAERKESSSGVEVTWDDKKQMLRRIEVSLVEDEGGRPERYLFYPGFMDFKGM